MTSRSMRWSPGRCIALVLATACHSPGRATVDAPPATAGALNRCKGYTVSWGLHPWPDDAGRLVICYGPQDIAEKEQLLASVSAEYLPFSLRGDIVVDAVVVKLLQHDATGQPRWLIQPEQIFSGSGRIPEGAFEIASPRADDGGIVLAAGQRYRLNVVEMRGRFYVWAGWAVMLK